MGWGKGSSLAENIWVLVWPYIPQDRKQYVAKRICKLFEDMDCDTLEEAEELYDAAYRLSDEDAWQRLQELAENAEDSKCLLNWIKENKHSETVEL